ncbi:penicillin-binding protein 2, partial [Candidatus Gottesmanbacteria bacterium]|nr:penicillin-binding protein 2 [Candidatus Gottesmanbacteria bacterium]
MTEEILALYTSPSFDANIFSQALPKDTYDKLFEDPDLPMFNRGIGGVYPPGSTFKIVTAIAGLEEAAITVGTVFEDIGQLVIGQFRFPNWYFTQYGKTEGLVGIVKAIQRSNDIFFYKAGEAIGITKLAVWAKRLGIGTPLGIEIPGEAGGLMPDPAWKAMRFDSPADRETRNNQWYLGDTYHVAIGQGY